MVWGTFGSQCISYPEEQGQIGGRKALLHSMFWELHDLPPPTLSSQEPEGRAVGRDLQKMTS